MAWAAIKAEDVIALQAYSLFPVFMLSCHGEVVVMQELDMPSNMRAVMSKLPCKLREQWRTVAHDILETSEHRAVFKDLVAFIEKQFRKYLIVYLVTYEMYHLDHLVLK